jgi:hypothetical protein
VSLDTFLSLIKAGDKEKANKILKQMGDNAPAKWHKEQKKMAGHIPTEGKGIFSPNSRKTNPNAPDWKGQLMVNGEIVKFSGWIKHSAYGEFLSLSVNRPMEGQTFPKENDTKYDGDIPF